MSAPRLFDRDLLRRRIGRAAPGNVLLDRVIDEMAERLSVVTRRFRRIADIGTPTPRLAERLAQADDPLVRVAPAAEIPTAGVATLVGDAERLPLRPGQFDLIVSALALQHADDLPGALLQIRRALQPDGLFLGAWLGGRTLHELRTALTSAEAEVAGGASPRVAPFVDVRDGGALLQRAGFALPVSDTDVFTLRYADMFALIADLRRFGATNPLVSRSRRSPPRRLFFRAAEIYAARHADADGRLRATFEILYLSGWAPHDSQQKPLAPGSAKMRLADALKPRE